MNHILDVKNMLEMADTTSIIQENLVSLSLKVKLLEITRDGKLYLSHKVTKK